MNRSNLLVRIILLPGARNRFWNKKKIPMPNAGYLWCQRLPKQCIWLPAFSWLPIRNRYWNSIAEKTTYFGYRTQRHQARPKVKAHCPRANPHPVRRKYVGSCEGEVFSSLTQLWALHATVLPCQARHAHRSKTRERGSKKTRQGDGRRYGQNTLFTSRRLSKWTARERTGHTSFLSTTISILKYRGDSLTNEVFWKTRDMGPEKSF